MSSGLEWRKISHLTTMESFITHQHTKAHSPPQTDEGSGSQWEYKNIDAELLAWLLKCD